MKSLEDVRWPMERLRLSAHRIYELARQRKIPHVRLGRTVKFDPSAVEEWIATGGTGPDGPTKEDLDA